MVDTLIHNHQSRIR